MIACLSELRDERLSVGMNVGKNGNQHGLGAALQ
jgi:hypothetical protein